MPNLEPARRRVEALMTDRVSVERDTGALTDDELDLLTGTLGPPTGDVTTVTTGLPCAISPVVRSRDFEYQAGSALPVPAGARWKLLVPVSSAPLHRGDRLPVTTAQRDPQLVGRRLRVLEPGQGGTFAVCQIVYCDEGD